jgi:hypothetical protein
VLETPQWTRPGLGAGITEIGFSYTNQKNLSYKKKYGSEIANTNLAQSTSW